MKKIILLIVASLGIITATQAQKINVESGDLSFLKGITEISVVFVYPDDMRYGKKTIQEYVDEKVEEKEKKQEGSGEKWKSDFFADRERFNEKFIHTLGKYSKSLSVAEANTEFKYTMIVKTTFTEPGFQFGFQSKGSAIDLEINFIETNAPDNVIAKVNMNKASGAAHPDFGERVANAYSNGGAVLGKYLRKKYL